MIEFKDPEHLLNVFEFAAENNCAAKLNAQLRYLAEYGDGNNICHLYRDHAPLSFEFLMLRPDGTRWFNGGLIYSGPGQPLNGSGPAFTVSLTNEPGHSWSVHT